MTSIPSRTAREASADRQRRGRRRRGTAVHRVLRQSDIDPASHLHKLLIGWPARTRGRRPVAADRPRSADRPVDQKSSQGGDRIDWKVVDEKEMTEELGKGKPFGALVAPRHFHRRRTHQPRGGAQRRPPDTHRAGQSAYAQVGRELTAQSELAVAVLLLLTDPTVAQVGDGHPLSHSGLGLSAFSYSLVLVVCGMLAANVISGQVDHALGHTHSDMGTLRILSSLLRATRVQTLALSSTLMPGMAVHHDLLHRHGRTDVRRHGPPPGTPRLPPHPRRVPAPASDHRRRPLHTTPRVTPDCPEAG